MLFCSARANIGQDKYQYIVFPYLTNNFAQRKSKTCLDLSGPTLHKEITYVMLAYG